MFQKLRARLVQGEGFFRFAVFPSTRGNNCPNQKWRWIPAFAGMIYDFEIILDFGMT